MDNSTAARLAELHAALAEVYRDLAQRRPAVPASVLTLREAAARLGMKHSWLSRRANWRRVGGYQDADRRVKFPLSALAEYIRTQQKH